MTKPANPVWRGHPAREAAKELQRASREQEEENELKRVQAAIAGAQRDLRAIFEFAGISDRNKKTEESTHRAQA